MEIAGLNCSSETKTHKKFKLNVKTSQIGRSLSITITIIKYIYRKYPITIT
jgi:hypothetical protein